MKEPTRDNDNSPQTICCYPEGHFPLKKVDVRIKPIRLLSATLVGIKKRSTKTPSDLPRSNIDKSDKRKVNYIMII